MLTVGRLTILLLAITLMGYQFPEGGGNSGNDTNLVVISESLSAMVRNAEQALVYIEVTKGGNRSGVNRQMQPSRKGGGSGFFVDREMGYIITNAHVVRDGRELTVTLANDNRYSAKIVGQSDDTDIAVIKIEDQDFNRQKVKHLTLVDSDKVQIGELAIALGAPYGLKSSVSLGIVSGVGRRNRLARIGDFIQTDVAMNPGNSGGPLLNSRGEVIGVNTGIYSRSGGYDGISFSVSANVARHVALRLIDSGKFESGYLGINLEPQLSDDARSFYPALEDHEKAVLVANVIAGSPAEKAGIRAADLIVEVNGEKTNSVGELIYQIGLNPPGTVVEVVVIKRGEHQRQTAVVKLGGNPKKIKDADREQGPQVNIWGIKFKQNHLGIVVVESKNYHSDIQVGDIIIAVDGIENPTLNQLSKHLKNRDKVQVRIKRSGISRVIVLHKH